MLVAIVVQWFELKKSSVETVHATMQAAIHQAASTRESISQLHQRQAFDYQSLVKAARQSTDYRQTTAYQAIPVIAAARSVDEFAKSRGWSYRIPSLQPRNPANAASPEEAEILKRFERHEIDDYFQVSEDGNTAVYAAPIRLTNDCLSCHGDPAKSPSHDGKDILGFRMEGWHEGQLRGAFVLRSSLQEAKASARKAMMLVCVWMIPVIGLLTIAFLYASRRHIITPLRNICNRIHAASQTTTDAAAQVAATGDHTAVSATQHAASVDQTVVAVKDLAGKARDNAAMAQKVNHRAGSCLQSVDRGREEMNSLTKAMVEIEQSNNDVAKLVKRVDEIAFQTNLLALNAAVEAARAGEAGAGFSVVADEVRALAQRCADTAKETQELVSASIEKSQTGSNLSAKMAAHLGSIETESRSLEADSRSIRDASEVQTRTAESLTSVIQEINSVSQHMAASSEELSSAGQELDQQAVELRNAMADFEQLLG